MKTIKITILNQDQIDQLENWLSERAVWLIAVFLSALSALSFYYYYQNGLSLAYNDARSHLDIGRRVVEGLSPGAAQLGSVWLPLTHFLMILTIWNDFMWHSGLSGALISMVAFVGTGIMIYKLLALLKAGIYWRFFSVFIFAANINILYLQSTAMTELLLLFTMTTGAYYFIKWLICQDLYHLLVAAFWTMLSTLVRYDGWFFFAMTAGLLWLFVWLKSGWRKAEGMFVLFCTLAGMGIFFWLIWNLQIFGDPLYFAFGPFSAHSQQGQLEAAGVLATKHNWSLSSKIYLYALAYNTGALALFAGLAGAIRILGDKALPFAARYGSLILLAPIFFNILALYLGHSVLFVAGLSGNSWFNVRYGIMMMPSVAVYIGFLLDRLKNARPAIILMICFALFFTFRTGDAVTIDDALTGTSQKNVSEVSGWLKENAGNKDGFILISVASHDAIIFSSGLPMKKFIHEGAGHYYQEAIAQPDKWARWIIVRSYSDADSTWLNLKDQPGFQNFQLVDHYPFADIYELKPEFLPGLETREVFKN